MRLQKNNKKLEVDNVILGGPGNNSVQSRDVHEKTQCGWLPAYFPHTRSSVCHALLLKG